MIKTINLDGLRKTKLVKFTSGMLSHLKREEEGGGGGWRGSEVEASGKVTSERPSFYSSAQPQTTNTSTGRAARAISRLIKEL